MTAVQLQAFHERTFCACGQKATRQVKNVGFCTRHLAEAIAASTAQAIEVDSARAAHDFIFDKRRCVARKYSNREGTI